MDCSGYTENCGCGSVHFTPYYCEQHKRGDLAELVEYQQKYEELVLQIINSPRYNQSRDEKGRYT